MKGLLNLVSGYKEFSRKERENGAYRYGELAAGQSPKIMVISCSDSRVIPSHIFNVEPGDMFVVRNVANLVPPFEEDESYHGTSAALEFAVGGLNVERIVVMGHSQCGGIEACVHKHHKTGAPNFFIDKWLSILAPVTKGVVEQNEGAERSDLLRALEFEAIKASVENLKTFPFIQKAMGDKTLSIHGAYFDVKDGQLYLLDKETAQFQAVE
jgi:carbonic anhydrase